MKLRKEKWRREIKKENNTGIKVENLF